MVNVWSLINQAAANEDSCWSDKCEEFLKKATEYGGFGSECSVDIDRFGAWTFRFFNHEEPFHEVEVRVMRDGSVRVSRVIDGDIREERIISF